MEDVKKDRSMCQTRYLDPNQKAGTKKDFYSEKTVREVIAKYNAQGENHVL